MWRRSALARSTSRCSNISGVTRSVRVTSRRLSSPWRSTWALNTPRAAAILRSLSGVSTPRTPETVAAVR